MKPRRKLNLFWRIHLKLRAEISSLRQDLAVYRGVLCDKLSKELIGEISASNKKLYEKLTDGYAIFSLTGDYNKSWGGFIFSIFPQPEKQDWQRKIEKFKASNDFMID